MVWLLLVPLFNFVWIFIMPTRIGDSLKNEFADREIDDGGNYGKTVGLAMVGGERVLGTLISWIGTGLQVAAQVNNPMAPGEDVNFGSLLAAPFQLASFVLWIVYWIKIAGYSRQLAEDDLIVATTATEAMRRRSLSGQLRPLAA